MIEVRPIAHIVIHSRGAYVISHVAPLAPGTYACYSAVTINELLRENARLRAELEKKP